MPDEKPKIVEATEPERPPIDVKSLPNNVETLADVLKLYAPDAEITEVDGHSGMGFYAYSTEYPDAGSTFLGDDGAVMGALAAELANRLSQHED